MKVLGQSGLEYFLSKIKGIFATTEQGTKADTAVQSVKIGSKEYKSGTDVVLPEYPTTLPASDVSSWAKASSKPTYTASEVGADPTGTASSAVSTHNSSTSAHEDIRKLVSDLDVEVDDKLPVYLTQEEYDALPDTKLTDGKLYMITDADPESSGGSSVEVLDTMEEIESNTEEDKAAGALAVKELNTEVQDLKTSFQDGCDTIVAGCTANGVTPASNSPDDIVAAIGEIYNLGSSDGSTGLYFIKTYSISMAGVTNATVTVDFSGMDGYENKTKSDFSIYPSGFSLHNSSGWWGGNITQTISSYNASTGKLTITCSGSVSQNYPIGISCTGVAVCKQ